jgi:hypothetical protein
MSVNGAEILASFPDLHKEITLNHKLKNDTVPAVIKMREHLNEQDSVKLAAATWCQASRGQALFNGMLLVKRYERLITPPTLFIGMR